MPLRLSKSRQDLKKSTSFSNYTTKIYWHHLGWRYLPEVQSRRSLSVDRFSELSNMVSHVRARWIYLPLIRSMKVLDHCTWSTLQDPCLTCEEFPPLHPINRVITLFPANMARTCEFPIPFKPFNSFKGARATRIEAANTASKWMCMLLAHGKFYIRIEIGTSTFLKWRLRQNGGILKFRIVRFHFAGISSKQISLPFSGKFLSNILSDTSHSKKTDSVWVIAVLECMDSENLMNFSPFSPSQNTGLLTTEKHFKMIKDIDRRESFTQ